MNPLTTIKKAIAHPGRILPAIVRRINPNSTWGTDVIRRGNFFTFTNRGFAAAQSIPDLMLRNYYEERYIRNLLANVKVAASLEVGCGFGRLSPVFAEFASQHTAIDINADALSEAGRHFPRIKFQQASATELPFGDGAFDLVVTWTVLQHIPPEFFPAAVAEIRRVLGPRGKLLLCEATRFPGSVGAHTFDRHPEEYARAFAPLRMTFSSYITELDEVACSVSPGQVMFFEP